MGNCYSILRYQTSIVKQLISKLYYNRNNRFYNNVYYIHTLYKLKHKDTIKHTAEHITIKNLIQYTYCI